MNISEARQEVRPAGSAAVLTSGGSCEPQSSLDAIEDRTTLSSPAWTGDRRKAPPVPAPQSSYAADAQKAQAQQSDLLTAGDIYFAMAADRQQHQVRLQAMLADLQTTIFEILQDVAARRQKAMDRAMEAWSRVLTGGEGHRM